PTILFVGGLNRSEQHKGLKTLLEAMLLIKEKIPNAQLTVVGDGDMRNEYESYVKNLDLQGSISFTGRLGGTNLAAAYQNAHVFALPTSNDSLPMTILEAMACELPVVSTKTGSIPTLIEEEKNGFLVNLHDHQILAKKIIELLEDEKQAKVF